MTQEEIDRALYRATGVYPYPQKPQNAGNANQINTTPAPYPPINGAPVSYSCNYGQNPPTPTEPTNPPIEP